MPAAICPRCQRASPDEAAYCHFDGAELRPGQARPAHRLPRDFVFPSGRCCQTFDELAQACQEEWASARELLAKGTISAFFDQCKRQDLAKAAEDARSEPNADIALTSFLSTLPGVRTQSPKLEINPRRFLLGAISVGENRTATLAIQNAGQGHLQGTVTVSEGQEWLSFDERRPLHEAPVSAIRDQSFTLHIQPRGLPANQSYGGKLTVVTNGGVVEVPLRLDYVAAAFTKPPLRGARTPQDLAEQIRLKPKLAAPLIESGDVKDWFESNGWAYPLNGSQVKGIAAVQQLFEAMGLSKPPVISVSPEDMSLRCQYPERSSGSVILSTPSKKWIYATVSSDRPWLKPMAAVVSGPQSVSVSFEIDPRSAPDSRSAYGELTLSANGGQKLRVRVQAEFAGTPVRTPSTVQSSSRQPSTPSQGAETRAGGSLVNTMIAVAMLFLLIRLATAPIIDGWLKPSAMTQAFARLNVEHASDHPMRETAGWLRLPWVGILMGQSTRLSAELGQTSDGQTIALSDLRLMFVSSWMRAIVLALGWLGAAFGAWRALKTGGASETLWGAVAGLVAGFIAAATFAAIFLVLDTVPAAIFELAVGATSGWFAWLTWVTLACVCWGGAGVVVGIIVHQAPWLKNRIERFIPDWTSPAD